MAIDKPAVYCPGRDDEFNRLAQEMAADVKGMYPEPLWGGEKKLGDVDSKVKLYLLCHSHYELSLFETDARRWTAKEMAEQLESDGLKKAHVDLELLVCNAGMALNSKKSVEQMRKLRAEYDKAVQTGNEKAILKAKNNYNAAIGKADKPAEYINKNQAMPLAAELLEALRKRKYESLAITAYKVPVAFLIRDNQISLNLTPVGGAYGMPLSDPDCKKQRVIWY